MAEVKCPEVKVGTIFCLPIGFTSRHPVFLKVVRRTNSTVIMKELYPVYVKDDGYHQNGTMIASDVFKDDKEIKSRLYTNKYSYDRAEIKVSCFYGYIWNGQEEAFYTD